MFVSFLLTEKNVHVYSTRMHAAAVVAALCSQRSNALWLQKVTTPIATTSA